MGPQLGQRFIGLLVLVGGIGGMLWVWRTAVKEGDYNYYEAGLFAGSTVLGLGALVFPVDKRKLREKVGTDKMETWWMMPPEWKALILGAVVCGFGSMLLIGNHEKAREARRRVEDPPHAYGRVAQDDSSSRNAEPDRERSYEVSGARSRGWSWRDWLRLLSVIAIVGGGIAAMCAQLWNLGTKVRIVLDDPVHEDSGMRIYWISFMVLCAGFGIWFLCAR
jgi:hypothetical protein